MTKLRDQYFLALGLNPHWPAAKPNIEAALARAYQLRSFEIEHCWKRATYFWGFQIVIFAAFGVVLKDSRLLEGEWSLIAASLPALGVLTAFAHSFSTRGSKFWQQNWEHHIDMLEDPIEGRLHKTVWLRNRKASFSVSGVNQALCDCFVVFWSWLLFTLHGYLSNLRFPAGVTGQLAPRCQVGSLQF